MARHTEPTEEQVIVWNEWVASRPEEVKKMAEKFEPWTLYKMKSTGHRVIIHAFNENNTLTVLVLGKFNDFLVHEREVFGIDPEDLEPTDVPATEGKVLIPNDKVDENLDALRVSIRPDLWDMGQDGKAIWKGDPALHPDRDVAFEPVCPKCGEPCDHTPNEMQGFAMQAAEEASDWLRRIEKGEV